MWKYFVPEHYIFTESTRTEVFHSFIDKNKQRKMVYRIVTYRKVSSGDVWEHTPEQRVAVSTFHLYSRGLRLAIPQEDDWPITISLRYSTTCCNHEARGQTIGLLQSQGSNAERIWWAGSASGKRATCPYSCSWRLQTMQVTNLIWVSQQPLVGHKVWPTIAKDS